MAVHTIFMDSGACCYPEAVERKVRLLQETGYNAICFAHPECGEQEKAMHPSKDTMPCSAYDTMRGII